MIKDARQFIREVRQETLKVTWPNRKEVATTTVVVFIMVGLMGLFLLAVDFIVSHGIQFILDLGK
jgi:preprotein translocase subunit SecE